MATMTMISLDTLDDSIPPFRPPEVMIASAIARHKPIERPNSAALTILPEELIVKILEWCDFKGVLACRLTCRVFRAVIANSTSLRYKLALSEHGMCDGSSNTLNKAEKLASLTAHATAWRNLNEARPEGAGMLVGWSAPMAVSGNLIVFSKEVSRPVRARARAHGHEDDDAEAEVGLRLPSSMERSLDLLVLRVPSALRRVEAAHWVLSLPANVSEVCIDASQDLLIYVLDCAFYMRTLSTGAVHPLVEHEGFFSMWNGSRRFDVFDVCVCGDFVAAGTRVYFISVWNWKTGQLVCDQISEVRFSSFDFLDEHHILLSISKEDSIYVYDLRRRSADHKHVKEQEIEADSKPVRFQLALPPINPARTSRYIQFRRNTLPTVSATPNYDGALVGGSPIFHADPRERLIVLRIATSPVQRGEEQFELHVPARTFLDHCAKILTSQRQWQQRDACEGVDEEGKMVLPWSAWCDAVLATPSRNVPYTVQARMITYGMRVVSHPPDWDEGVLHVDSYLPRKRSREDGAGGEEVGGGKRADGSGTRQAIRLPGDVESKAGLLSVLCEDALLCYKLDLLSSKISHAYWYTF